MKKKVVLKIHFFFRRILQKLGKGRKNALTKQVCCRKYFTKKLLFRKRNLFYFVLCFVSSIADAVLSKE